MSWRGKRFYPRHHLQSRISPKYILFILATYTTVILWNLRLGSDTRTRAMDD
ncbi:hypothetical protein EV363DRAFT_1169327 [Boletus edulis]|uniref:Uncharacterized protein n=1 Tax=Boletus edulis BED1 TaxID=1328754 RepID=A0AAD4BR34_BOLED|nr:hypothetical protein EV363DRAFT_1169327 [Boletus edulis]KAF8437567.1 hypothetical protein L210DRAFT_954580 [Boletus edulis BED1]